ncbi:DUF4347 domain-containing protein [Azospirillum argentinense]
MDTIDLLASTATLSELRAADPAANGGRKEVVFVDGGVADWQALVAGVGAGVEVVLLNGAVDGLAQMAAWAAGKEGYDAIHVLSHGAEGQLRLGTLVLDTAAVSARSAELAALGGALADGGDLLLYGCDVAGGNGAAFVAALATATGADVAASIDRTGSFAAGGNWVLETGIGSLETSSLVLQGYAHTLAPLAPTTGNDSLTGTAGNDSIAGLAGNDTLRGGDGNDTLDGGDGDDSLYGDVGNDSLEGGDGNDYLDGDTGNDTLVGGAGNDILIGGAGNDSLVGGDGNDTFSIGSLSDYTADDIIDGGAGDDTIRFFSTTAGNTLVLNSNVTDSDGTISIVISGTATGGLNSAAVNIDASAVTLTGGVTISGNGEANTLTGTAQNDTINAANGNDTLFGGAGDDSLSGGNGDDSIVGGTGNDYLDGGSGNDSLIGGDGDDTLSGGIGTDSLIGGDGDDVFLISDATHHTADETINGGAGNDVIRFYASSSNAVLVLNSNLTDSDGTITIDVSRRADGSTTNTALGVDASAVTLTGGVTIIGNAGKNVLTGSAYNDSINGGNGDNVLDGGDGDDTIIGGNGNDTIIGGAGTDSLFGGSFNDVFGIAAGSHHTANETIDGGTSSDTIRFYSATDGDTLTLNSNLKNGSNTFTIAITGDVNGAASSASVNVDASAVTLSSGVKIFGSAGNNVLTGTAQSDSIEGGAGNDSINGGDGRDTLNGGDGNDTLIGGGNNDSLNGGDGDDSLEGGVGNDTLTGGAGNDTLTGGAGNDIFVDPNGDVITTLESGDIIRLTGGAAQMLDASHLQYDSGTKTLTVDWDKSGTFGGGSDLVITFTDAPSLTTFTVTNNGAFADITMSAAPTGPTVTDANISISGGSGTGGAYKIGDTVTATWNNTATGDNNAETLTGVTVDFSQFGGGSAVAATNNNGVWTATYTITAGSIDATNRNVSVTATTASGSTTRADGTNATVDNVAPTLTLGNMAGLASAVGTNNTLRIGSTVKAVWDNSGSGDGSGNTDTIASVTADFSQYGGGSAVAMTNTNGVWEATYTIVAGSFDATGRNVAITVTDNAGNSKTVTDTANHKLDNVAPTVTDANIAISGGTGTGGAYKIGDTVTATWDNTLSGDNNTDTLAGVTMDFSQFGGGSAVAATNSNGVWTATYTIASGSIDDTNRNVSVTVTDNAGNATTTADTANATVDNQTPRVTDGNIAISGGTGTGGAYKIGDTVTATWNDSNGLLGDLNSDVLSSVTVDFSQFGGGTAVAATWNNGLWTATHTITSAPGGATNLNVSVTVTDDAGNVTTTADTTNATLEVAVPTVTDANIAISGASGTGGVYKIGDIVTAIWDDTIDGDNNTDTVSGVTMDFSQFGGGSAVAATNSNGVWTATYTITAGSIDDTSRNVSVSASLAGAGTTTTADTTNATVDNQAPTVTDGHISVSGATGTGGAYKIGDTVTATWDDTLLNGDNNTDTLSGVTFDFSAFGGGSAVAGVNNGGVWTATHTITGGSIDATNRNVSVTVTDDAGNGTTTADSSNATVDNVAPTVTDANISISGATGIGGAFKIGDTVTVVWNGTADGNTDTLAGVTVDFSQFGGGSAVAATNSNGVWTATHTIVSGSIDATGRNVSVTATDDAGNTKTGADSSNAVVDDREPWARDSFIAISGATGTGGVYKIGDTVTATWDNRMVGGDNNTDSLTSVTFDFSAFGGGSAVAASQIDDVWTATCTITAGSIDAANRNVSVTVTDDAGNTATGTDTTNATVDNVAPTVTDANLSISGGTGTGGAFKAGDTVTATWNNTLSGDNNTDTLAGVTIDFSQFGGGSAVAATNSNGVWTATHTIAAGSPEAANRNVSVTVTDNAGNTTTRTDTTNATVDTAAPSATLTLSDTSLDETGAATLTITFTEAPVGFTLDDLSVSDATLSNLTVQVGSNGLVYTATLTPDLDVEATGRTVTLGTGWTDAAGNAPAATASSPAFSIDTLGAAGVIATPSGSVTSEAGGAVTVAIVLATRPRGDVTIPLSVSKPGEAQISVGSLTFTTANWDTPQTVTVTGLDDGVNDGAQAYDLVLGAITSTDSRYAGLDPADVALSNADDDPPFIALAMVTRDDSTTGDPTVRITGIADAGSKMEVWRDLDNDGVLDPEDTLLTSVQLGDGETAFAIDVPLPNNALTDLILVAVDADGHRTAPLDVIQRFRTVETGSGTNVTNESSVDGDGNERVDVEAVSEQAGEFAEVVLTDQTEDDGEPMLTASVSAGTRLVASGPAAQQSSAVAGQTLGNSLLTLAASADGTEKAALQQLASRMPAATSALGDATPVTVRQIVVTAGSGGATTGPVTIRGTADQGDGVAAVVLDTRQAAGRTEVNLDNVSIAVILGEARIGGGEGNNAAYGDSSAQFMRMGPGDDTLSGGGGNDTIASTTGNDLLSGDDGDDLVHGGEDNDTVLGGAGNDTVGGGTGDDYVFGGTGDDMLFGEDGNDWVIGGDGLDILSGGAGNDLLFGEGGNDTVFGGDGNDVAFGQEGDDILSLEAGNDIADGGVGNDTLFGGDGNDTLFGGEGADILSLDAGDDLADGGMGNDTLFGGAGNDTLFGGAGADVVDGGAGDDMIFLIDGADTAWGGAGRDVFAFGTGGGGSVVMDFTVGTDRLALADASISLAGVIASARVVGGSTVLDLRPGSSVTIQGQTGDVAQWFA